MFFIICQGCAQVPTSKSTYRQEITPGAWVTEDYLPLLKGKRVGLVVNQTSIIGDTHLVDSLVILGINVVKLFTPEHGLRGQAEAGESIRDDVDAKTGIKIISLYGEKKKPAAADLDGIDIMVFDIQDVGVRFYTYISTLSYMMEALAIQGISLIILDRPNPNGHYIDGPALDTVHYRSFVGMHPIPVVYGMTIGELARMINGENWIPALCNLTVISCKNYDHGKLYELPIKPSPNLPNIRAILHYPGLCFFEGTSVSVGRGTPAPFQVVGHPDYPDTVFSFIPKPMRGAMHPPLEGKTCYGIDLRSVDIDSLFDTNQMNISILLKFYNTMRGEGFFNPSWFDKLAGGSSFRESIEKGWSEQQIRESWKSDIEAFKKKREAYLLYPDTVNNAPKK